MPDQSRVAIEIVREKYDSDIYVYSGPLFPPYDAEFAKLLRANKRRKNCLLILTTQGGLADSAYKIGRAIQRRYGTYSDDTAKRGRFYLYVPLYCKSAGTLLSLSADEIIMSHVAELGPIDAQLLRSDEVGERTSGLSSIETFPVIQQNAVSMFKRYFEALRFEGLNFSTKLAAEIAAKLTIGVFEPISSQIDPLRLAETARSVRIAADYGHRLRTSNVREDTIERLLAAYPSHGFVIDRREVRELFENVSKPIRELEQYGELCSAEAIDGNMLSGTNIAPLMRSEDGGHDEDDESTENDTSTIATDEAAGGDGAAIHANFEADGSLG